MCCVAVKYIKGIGWVGAKNRDRNYKVTVDIVRSLRDDIQRLYIDDTTTRWTEGINEFGLSIISASFSVKSDEKEGGKVKGKEGKKSKITSPDGLKIRRALMLKDPKEAAELLIAGQLAGATYIFNAEDCFLLEGGFTIRKKAAKEKGVARDYKYKLTKIDSKIGYSVRTNHGVFLPELGYNKSDKENRKSSESRLKAIVDAINKNPVRNGAEFLACISVKPHEDAFMNPIRLGDLEKGDMVTTGQLLLIPAECSLHYRPIYSSVQFDYAKLNNGAKNKVFFEIISDRKLLSFNDFRKK